MMLRVTVLLDPSFLTCKMNTPYQVTSKIPSQASSVDMKRGHQCASMWESRVDLRKRKGRGESKRKGDRKRKGKKAKARADKKIQKRTSKGWTGM